MVLWIFKLIFKLKGWKINHPDTSTIDRSIMIASPHTSNWDLIFCLAAFNKMGIPARFTVKKEWFKFPFKRMMTNLGGIPIDRNPKIEGEKRKSTIEAMANLFKEHKRLSVIVTPEGSRSLKTEWKMGFYHTAKLANVPIAFGYLDYKNKVAGVGGVLYPSDNMEEDLKKIMSFYININPKYPALFSVDKRYI